MKAVSVTHIKKELQHASHEELINLCLRLSKFKKENKELLTYLLFEAHDEAGYIVTVNAELDELFETINTSSFHYIKKSVRKILRRLKVYARYSLKPETEIELLLHFCERLQTFKPSIFGNTSLLNIYDRQIITIHKLMKKLHEDLQYDYKVALERLESR